MIRANWAGGDGDGESDGLLWHLRRRLFLLLGFGRVDGKALGLG